MTQVAVKSKLHKLNLSIHSQFKGWREDGCSTWRVTLQRDHQKESFDYFMGSAHTGEPEISDVVYCILMDAQALNAQGFEDWAAELGYDTDSRKAEKTYQACLDNARKLQTLFPDFSVLESLYEDY